MKTHIKVSIMLVLAAFLFVRARHNDPISVVSNSRQSSITLPADVKAIVDNKCYGCHSDKGKSQEAREDMMWDSIPLYPKDRQIAVLDDIADVVSKGDMPPEKFVSMHPEAKLDPMEMELIRNWANNTADMLMK